MAQEVVIRLQVKGDADINQLKKELDSTAKSFQKVEKEADQTKNKLQEVGENGGAIAVLDSLTGGLATRVRDAAEATKVLNFSLKGTRTALIATGIGAFVVAVGLLVAYWDDIVDFVQQTNERLETTIDLSRKIQGTLEAENALIESQINQRKQQGLAYEQLQKQQIEINKKTQEANQLELESLKLTLARLKSENEELGVWTSIRFQMAQIFGGADGLAATASAEANKRLLAVKELEAAILSAEKKAIDLNIALFNLENPQENEEQDVQEREKVKALNKLSTYVEETELIVGEMARRQELLNQAELNGIRIREQYRQENIARIKTGLGALQNIFGAFGKESKVLAIGQIIADKVSAVSQIISNTAIANAKSLAVSPLTGGQPWVGINTALAGLSIAGTVGGAITAIQQLKSNSTSIGGGAALPPGIGASGGASAQPTFNVIGNTGINQLNDAINERTNEPVKAYVTMSDISRGQSIERNTISEASVG